MQANKLVGILGLQPTGTECVRTEDRRRKTGDTVSQRQRRAARRPGFAFGCAEASKRQKRKFIKQKQLKTRILEGEKYDQKRAGNN